MSGRDEQACFPQFRQTDQTANQATHCNNRTEKLHCMYNLSWAPQKWYPRIDLLSPSLSTKERLQHRLNVQGVAHPFYVLTSSKGMPLVQIKSWLNWH